MRLSVETERWIRLRTVGGRKLLSDAQQRQVEIIALFVEAQTRLHGQRPAWVFAMELWSDRSDAKAC